MEDNGLISGFSKLSREQKIEKLNISFVEKELINKALSNNTLLCEIIDELSENTISHFALPFGVAPNVLINGKNYFLPLVTEESSVVAAIAKSSRFWAEKGGFTAKVHETVKKGQVHFFWQGETQQLVKKFPQISAFMYKNSTRLTNRMRERGGGIIDIKLVDKTHQLPNYFCVDADFETIDAMGANFINTCLEDMADSLKFFVDNDKDMDINNIDVVMSILSNYTPNNKVHISASCTVFEINEYGKKLGVENFAYRFVNAFKIAHIDVSRAVTHNKGIFNGIDAVLLATANDWRAVEAGGHAYAARNGQYSSLSNAYIKNQIFTIELDIPIAIGTVGGVTNLHPMAKLALAIMENPSAIELMQLTAASGLAANFSAVSALVSTGIQEGHMKMHMSNLNRQSKNSEQESAEESVFIKKNSEIKTRESAN